MKSTHDHVETIFVRKACDHSRNERMASHGSQGIPFIANVLNLLQANDWGMVSACNRTRYLVVGSILSTLRSIFNAKTLLLHSEVWPRKRESHTRAKVPRVAKGLSRPYC